MIIFLDKGTSRGGGQVVLESMLHRLGDRELGLIMPPSGRSSIDLSDRVQVWDDTSEMLSAPPPGPFVLICNANASLPHAWNIQQSMRRRGIPMISVAIVHNYAGSFSKRMLTEQLLERMGLVIVVEPGLTSLNPRAMVPAWLSVPPRSQVADHQPGIVRTGAVKSYGRPDRAKGLHLLPAIFRDLSARGMRCEVAIGEAMVDGDAYRKELVRDLAPWLVDGPRTAAWVEPGDIFMIPSTFGEAACLTAQEAMSGGAFVIASRLGLMPYLSPSGKGIRTFAVDDTDDALLAVGDVLALDSAAFSAECMSGVQTIAEREGLWYDQVLDRIRSEEGRLIAV